MMAGNWTETDQSRQPSVHWFHQCLLPCSSATLQTRQCVKINIGNGNDGTHHDVWVHELRLVGTTSESISQVLMACGLLDTFCKSPFFVKNVVTVQHLVGSCLAAIDLDSACSTHVIYSKTA